MACVQYTGACHFSFKNLLFEEKYSAWQLPCTLAEGLYLQQLATYYSFQMMFHLYLL